MNALCKHRAIEEENDQGQQVTGGRGRDVFVNCLLRLSFPVVPSKVSTLIQTQINTDMHGPAGPYSTNRTVVTAWRQQPTNFFPLEYRQGCLFMCNA